MMQGNPEANAEILSQYGDLLLHIACIGARKIVYTRIQFQSAKVRVMASNLEAQDIINSLGDTKVKFR